jgi:ferredoxin-NADP reductase
MGSFTLPATDEGQIVFIGTGTGFAPLYFQAKTLLEKNPNTEIVFIF